MQHLVVHEHTHCAAGYVLRVKGTGEHTSLLSQSGGAQTCVLAALLQVRACSPCYLFAAKLCRINVIQGHFFLDDTSVLPKYAFSNKFGKFGLATYHISNVCEAMLSSHRRLRV